MTTYFERFLDPWREFDRMGSHMSRSARCGTCEYPAVNVWTNGANAEISSEVPGIDREKLDISVAGNTVTLKGTRTINETKEGDSWHRHELPHGDFSKTIRLPFNIDTEKVHASYRNGILHISLPQLEADKPRKIEIK